MMLFQLLLADASLFISQTIMQTLLALESDTFILLKSLTNPIVLLLFGLIYLLTYLALTALKIITFFYLPWKESIVFTSHFLFNPKD